MSKNTREQLIVDFIQSYRSTGQLFFKLIHSAMQEKQLSNTAHLPILKVLARSGSMPQSAIARELHHSNAAVSRQVGILVDEGLVTATSAKENRRISIVGLTDDGRKVLAETEAIVTSFLSDILSEVPDEQLENSIDYNNRLQKIITTNLEKESDV